jgi:selenocysteine-specific elongation factor
MGLTVGTAGHIDHGKTSLVRALTGKDTDRLREEHRRGISIELGYAPLALPDGRQLSVVDVPGHERFVRTMVAGATGIDLFLLVVDAGEGARPQTHEHLAILRLLNVEHGVVAVTKADAVDAETVELAVEEARGLVAAAEVVAVSSVTGTGLDELRAALGRTADLVAQRHKSTSAPARLHVDRAFTLHGIGTVATGTLWSGTIAAGDLLRVEPRGLEVRVRSVQVHDHAVERAEAGQRVAVSLPGIERTRLRRGDVLVDPGSFVPSYRLDVLVTEIGGFPADGRVTAHHGTAETPARVVRLGENGAQLRLARPVVAARGDRVVLRTDTTVGGATVLDPLPPRHADAERIARLARGEAGATVHVPVLAASLARLGVDESADGLRRSGDWVFSDAWLEELRARLEAQLDVADPLDPGIEVPPERWARDVVPLLGLERRGSRLYRPGASASLGARDAEARELESTLELAGFAATKVEDRELARFLETAGRIVRLGEGFAVGRAAYDEAVLLVRAECESAGRVALARFRDLAGVGRRDAQLLLERMDADGVTRRVGDARVLRARTTKP